MHVSTRSHYFKKDKSFMNKLSELAVSLAYDLDLHKVVSGAISRHKTTWLLDGRGTVRSKRTLEERRTFVALFHLTSA